MDFYTLFCYIAAASNSRPLGGISENADCGNILQITHNLLILGKSLTQLTAEIYIGIEEPRKNVCLKERCKLRLQMVENLWNSLYSLNNLSFKASSQRFILYFSSKEARNSTSTFFCGLDIVS